MQKQNKKSAKSNSQNLKSYIDKHHFRVAIFGSARINEANGVYREVFDLANRIGKKNYDIITGGGPGLMLAASEGHQAANPGHEADSIGFTISLPWEVKENTHLDILKNFDRFSDRLDHFIALSNVFVVMPGGIGTCLELFYVWQHIQVKHISEMPIILVGKMWKELIGWIKKYPIKDGLISPKDLTCLHIVKNNREAMKIIDEEHRKFLLNKKNGAYKLLDNSFILKEKNA